MSYDGTGSLKAAIAKLYRLSPKSNNALAKLIQESRKELSIDPKAQLTDEQKLALYTYHSNKLNMKSHTPDDMKFDINSDMKLHTDNNNMKSATNDDDDFKMVSFRIKLPDGRYSGLSIERFFVDAIMSRLNLENNAGVRGWIESLEIDPAKPLTRQIKREIVRFLGVVR